MSATAPRPRRANPSAINTPTEIHVKSSSTITKEDAESVLSEFISTSEAIANTFPTEGSVSGNSEFNSTGLSNSSDNKVILGQLKRVQRDLRGLPPLAAELVVPQAEQKKFGFDEEPKNKKIKFDDSDDENEQAEDGEVVEEDEDEDEDDE